MVVGDNGISWKSSDKIQRWMLDGGSGCHTHSLGQFTALRSVSLSIFRGLLSSLNETRATLPPRK